MSHFLCSDIFIRNDREKIENFSEGVLELIICRIIQGIEENDFKA